MASKRIHEEDENNNVKKKHTGQKYKSDYHETWECLGPSQKGDEYAHCSVCNSDFSISHGGRFDCRRHIERSTHQDFLKVLKGNSSMKDFFVDKNNLPVSDKLSRQRSVTKAELLLCNVIAQMNLSLSSAPVIADVMKQMFPDSKIAQDMTCGRNKITVMIKELGLIRQDDLSGRLISGPYTISTDGSTDEKSKQYPLVVRTLCQKTGMVSSELLCIPICQGSATGENIFKILDEELSKRNIPWSNCLSLGCDNASVMTGHKKGVFAFVKKKQPQVFLSGCTLHLIHIGAKKGAKVLSSVDDVLIDIFYFFNKSEKRQSNFKNLQDLCSLEQKKMLKHVCTRWLSISRCIDRLLYNWEALKVFFKQEKEACMKASLKTPKDTCTKSDSKTSEATSQQKDPSSAVYREESYAEKKVNSIYKFVSSPTNKLFVIFLSYTVKMFDEVLLGLQSEEPKIHVMRRMLHKLIRNILKRFVKPSAMISKSVDEVSYKLSCNVKANSKLIIGEDATKFIADKDQNYLKPRRIEEFFEGVVTYFQTLCDYLMVKLPLNDPLLAAAEVVDVELQSSSKLSDIHFFMDRYPCLISTTKDIILEQFSEYQFTDISSCKSDRIDLTWSNIGNMKDLDGSVKFKELSLFMLGILTIPHSSAHCERIFSCVRKNRTEQRSCLGDDTLEALLVIKSTESVDLSNKTLDHINGSYYRSLTQ